MDDYIDLAAEERAIQTGLNALQFFFSRPVRREDPERAMQIAEAIRVLEQQKKRAEEDVLFLRTEFDSIVGHGVKMRDAIARRERSWLTRLFKQ